LIFSHFWSLATRLCWLAVFDLRHSQTARTTNQYYKKKDNNNNNKKRNKTTKTKKQVGNTRKGEGKQWESNAEWHLHAYILHT